MHNQPFDFTQQGKIPLGLTVFSADNVKRDALQVGWVETELGRLLARRSLMDEQQTHVSDGAVSRHIPDLL